MRDQTQRSAVQPPTGAVGDAYEAFAPTERRRLLHVRDLIFEIAAETPGVGPLTETLKWGQPSYATEATGAGTPVRLGLAKGGDCGVFVHCRTQVMSDLRPLLPDTVRVDGNRGVLFDAEDGPDDDALRMLIRSALTYRLRQAVRG